MTSYTGEIKDSGKRIFVHVRVHETEYGNKYSVCCFDMDGREIEDPFDTGKIKMAIESGDLKEDPDPFPASSLISEID